MSRASGLDGVHDSWSTYRQVDEFFRLYQVGFVALWPLLGLACSQRWTAGTVAGLVVASTSFNAFGGILNDLFDLPFDRQSRERSQRWLVTGAVSEGLALTVALLQIPLLMCVHWAAGFRPAAFGWMVAALIGQALYDAFGKRSRVPPIAECGEAVAGSCLVMYGATCLTTDYSPLVWPVAASSASMLLLVNAFHGGLRDLEDDLRQRVTTTPILLGCSPTADGVRISRAMSVYALLSLSTLILSAMLVALAADWRAVLATGVCCAVNGALFFLLHRVAKPLWDTVLRANVLLVSIPIIAAFIPRLAPGETVTLLAVYFIPILPLTLRFLTNAPPAHLRTRQAA